MAGGTPQTGSSDREAGRRAGAEEAERARTPAGRDESGGDGGSARARDANMPGAGGDSTARAHAGRSAQGGRAMPRRRRRRWSRWVGGVVLALVVVGVAARLYLPYWLQGYVNRTLDQSPDYDGEVGEIDVHLWKGAYSIRDLNIVKTTHSVPVPFFESPRVEFTLSWKALLHGAARGRIYMEQPRLNFVQGPTPEESQSGADQPWLQIIDELYPFRIDRAEVAKGEIHFQAPHMNPPIDVYLSDMDALLTNLTNIEDKLDPKAAELTARATAMGSGQFSMDLSFDPHSHRPTFSLAAKLLDMDVRKLNPLTRGYGEFDFEQGKFDFVVEASAKDGFMEGYAKPLFRNLVVLGRRDLEEKDALQVFWEALVGAVGGIFKNQPRDQIGTRITLEGELDNPRTNMFEMIGGILYNAFVRAYLPRLEGGVAPDQVRSGEPAKRK
jgi:hypothetical protein